MYKPKRMLRNNFGKIKYTILISFIPYLVGIIIGALNTDISNIAIDEYLNYNDISHIYRCVLYFIIVLLVSNCSFGAPVIIYLIYIYGVNNGVILNLFFSLCDNYIKMMHIVIISSTFSVLAAVIMGGSAISLSKEVFLNVFAKKNNKLSGVFINNVVLILIGISLYYFSDIYKLKLLEYIK